MSLERERPKVDQIIVGYAREGDAGTQATGTVTLVREGCLRVLVDCGDPWNGGELINKLMQKETACSEITHVVVSHGHIDHCANLNLFKNAKIFMALDFVTPDGIYSAIDKNNGYKISDQIRIEVLKGHTAIDLVVFVENTVHGTVAIAGDIFESENDEGKWQEVSDYPEDQVKSRGRILEEADLIVPGHGEMFQNPNKA